MGTLHGSSNNAWQLKPLPDNLVHKYRNWSNAACCPPPLPYEQNNKIEMFTNWKKRMSYNLKLQSNTRVEVNKIKSIQILITVEKNIYIIWMLPVFERQAWKSKPPLLYYAGCWYYIS